MKKYLLFAVVIGMVTACSTKSSDEKSPEDLNANYLEKAKVYMKAKIKEQTGKASEKVIDFEIIKIDSSHVLTGMEVEEVKMTELRQEFITQTTYALDLKDIDVSYLGHMTAATQIEIDKANALADSVERWEKRSKKLANKKTDVTVVFFTVKFKRADGTANTKKGTPMYFNKDGDLDSELMSLVY